MDQTPINFSDYAMVYGGQACGVMAGYLTLDEGILSAVVAACNGMIMGTFMLFVGLMLVGQPPAIFYRIKNGEPIDDVPVKKSSSSKSQPTADEQKISAEKISDDQDSGKGV